MNKTEGYSKSSILKKTGGLSIRSNTTSVNSITRPYIYKELDTEIFGY